ncbi:MAG: hypothetical protein MI784_08840 [Cytophagales bacterium]|nr:hypothetical protein [Cytophagales bacterium]
MTKDKLATIVVIASCLGVLIFGLSKGKPIDQYMPRDPEEKQLIDLIKKFHRARAEYNPENYFSCLSESGRFMFSGSPMLSKKELEKRLPGFWTDLKSGNMTTRAYSRESLNGNFLDGNFFDPVIRIEGRKAHAVLKFITPILRWQTMLFLDFEKADKGWLITRFEWDMG